MNFALLLIAWVGHLVWFIASHNYFWGRSLEKWLGDLVHLCHLLLVLGLWPVAVLVFGWDLAGLLDLSTTCVWQRLLQVYLVFCLLTVLVWLPVLTWLRACRKDAAREVRTEVVNLAEALGQRPFDPGQRAFFAYLPGNQLFHIAYVEKTLLLPRLPPAWEGLKVLHLSDLHLHGVPNRDYFRAIMARCAAWQPDVVAITGDLVDSDTHHRWLIPLLGRVPWNDLAIAILGNHDHRHPVEPIRRRLRRLGMHVPVNTWQEVTLRGERLILIGHEGPWLPPEPDLSDCPREGFRLCLSHTPDNFSWAQRHGIDLMLSGHVHGGQIRIPVFGSVLVPSCYGRRYDQGTFVAGPTLMHVTRGISGAYPARYDCLPEVNLLRLVRGTP
jgi:predicted MPP superfamily phosphohydrolase